jgi:hypothetical protein
VIALLSPDTTKEEEDAIVEQLKPFFVVTDVPTRPSPIAFNASIDLPQANMPRANGPAWRK